MPLAQFLARLHELKPDLRDSAIQDVKSYENYLKNHPAMYALVFGILSGTSLPLGSCLGIRFSPASSELCGMLMAFGAGALLFAVTVELYGHALRDLSNKDLGLFEMFVIIFGALIGAAFYLWANRWLEEYLTLDDDDSENTERSSSSNGEKPMLQCRSEPGKVRRDTKRYSLAVSDLSRLHLAHTPRIRGREKGMRALMTQEEHAKSTALALFLGLLVDGVPEGILMGFLAAEGNLPPVLIISLFVANFPEAFSSASLLLEAKMSKVTIVGMWTGLCLVVGLLGGLSAFILLSAFPTYGQTHGADLPMEVLGTLAFIEGVTGGAMIACISSVMLPEAFERGGKQAPFYAQSGFMCTCGFLVSVSLKALLG